MIIIKLLDFFALEKMLCLFMHRPKDLDWYSQKNLKFNVKLRLSQVSSALLVSLMALQLVQVDQKRFGFV